jgi:hypothetical protein
MKDIQSQLGLRKEIRKVNERRVEIGRKEGRKEGTGRTALEGRRKEGGKLE